MAERRMFAKSIVLSDAFLDMPLSARCLYFTLGMMADDDGFVGNPKSIMRTCGASQDDMSILLQKRYVLGFDTGIIVIKHWRMNNYLRNDRYHCTTYLEEKDTLEIDGKGAYTEKAEFKPIADVGIPVGIPETEKRYTEVRLGKDSIDNKYNVCFEEFWSHYPRKKEKAKAYKCYQTRLKDGYTEAELLEACVNYETECKNTGREEQYIKLGATFLSASTPFADYLNKNYTPPKPKKTASDFTQREYDFAELEKLIK